MSFEDPAEAGGLSSGYGSQEPVLRATPGLKTHKKNIEEAGIKWKEEQCQSSKPQGFRMAQLRKRGHFFCLRGCGAVFDTKQEEENHERRRGETCPNYLIERKSKFEFEEIPTKTYEEMDKMKEVMKEFIRQKQVRYGDFPKLKEDESWD